MIIKERSGDRGAYSASRHLYQTIKTENIIASNWSKLEKTVDWLDNKYKTGGVIILSIDEGTIVPDGKEFIDWTEKLTETVNNRLSSASKSNKKENNNFISKIKNKLFKKDKIDDSTNELIKNWTIGKFLTSGTYYCCSDNTVFDKDSLSLELLGISLQTLVKIAEVLCRTINQKNVVVKDYNNTKILYVNGK